jgi:4-amino-4-deoxychorismate lyase
MLSPVFAEQFISIRDRGLLYGDGVFRTFPAYDGKVPHWSLHYQKLQQDCTALGIICPEYAQLTRELMLRLAAYSDAVFKIVVTRGIGQRGYAPAANAEPTHFWDNSPLPIYPDEYSTRGVKACFCQLRLSEQPRLAGIKHLNRLENVLAAAEIHDAAEGLMCDAQGRVIEGTRSNIFLVKNGQLITPDLSRCGVAGLQRQRIIAQMLVLIQDVSVADLMSADEVFFVNSVMGVWSVRSLGAQCWTAFPVADQVRKILKEERT